MNKIGFLSFRRWLGRKGIGLGLRILDPAARREFLRKPDVPSFAKAYAAMKARGIAPRAAVDVGGNRGTWSRQFHAFFPEARILVVEPQPELGAGLEEVCSELGGKAVCAHCLLGASIREDVPFQILNDKAGGSGSSVFPEHSNVPRYTARLPMTTLDQLVKDMDFPPPDFVKIDTQGYELEVLRGAREVLASTEFVLLEVSTWPFNIGAPLMPEVLEWMAASGFVTWDVCGIHRLPDGTLCHLDLLFVRGDSRHRSSARVLFKEWA